MTKKWAKHRQRIVSLYLDENKPLHEVREIMIRQQNFHASTRAYRNRFLKWSLFKYSPQRRRSSVGSVSSSGEAKKAPRPTAALWDDMPYPQAEPTSPQFASPEMAGLDRVYSHEGLETSSPHCTTHVLPTDISAMYNNGSPAYSATTAFDSTGREVWFPSPVSSPCQQQHVDSSCGGGSDHAMPPPPIKSTFVWDGCGRTYGFLPSTGLPIWQVGLEGKFMDFKGLVDSVAAPVPYGLVREYAGVLC